MDKMIDLINQGGTGEYDARQERGEAVAWGSEEHAELLALDLAEDEFDDPHQMVWEGYPPEPWGECWQQLIPDARRMIERVTAIAHPTPDAGRVAELEKKLGEQRRISVTLNDQCVDYCRRIAALEAQLAESREREGRMREVAHCAHCGGDKFEFVELPVDAYFVANQKAPSIIAVKRQATDKEQTK